MKLNFFLKRLLYKSLEKYHTPQLNEFIINKAIIKGQNICEISKAWERLRKFQMK